jgi:hypothetical protein
MQAKLHGHRTTYQLAGCRCTPCRAAEALYRAHLRLRKAKGLHLLGALISPVEARLRIRQLQREGYTRGHIARLAGWQKPALSFTHRQRIRFRTWLRIRRVAQFAMCEGLDSSSADEI